MFVNATSSSCQLDLNLLLIISTFLWNPLKASILGRIQVTMMWLDFCLTGGSLIGSLLKFSRFLTMARRSFQRAKWNVPCLARSETMFSVSSISCNVAPGTFFFFMSLTPRPHSQSSVVSSLPLVTLKSFSPALSVAVHYPSNKCSYSSLTRSA